MEEKKTEENKTENSSKATKQLYIALGFILICFIALFAIRFIRSPTGKAVTIDELHEKNLKGEMTDINYMYNGFSFVFADGLWYTQVQKGNTVWDVPLHFGPKQVENISVIGNIDTNFNKKDVWFTQLD